MASKRPRLECLGCGQNLSYSAYCRHQQLHNAASDVDSETDSDNSFSGELMATTSTSGDSLDNSDDGSSSVMAVATKILRIRMTPTKQYT